MARLEVSPTYYSQLDATATRPNFYVLMLFNGVTEDKLQTADDPNSYGYTTGVDILSLTDSVAQIQLPATPTRITQVSTGTWRAGYCTITAMPYNSSSGYTIIDGTINSAAYDGNAIQVEILSTNLLGKFAPVYTYDSFAHYMPADGEVMTWDSEPVVAVRKPAPSSGRSLADVIYSGGTW